MSGSKANATPPPPMRPNSKLLLASLSRSLTSFQSSQDAFRVIYTLPHHQPSIAAPSARRPKTPVRKLVVLDSSFNPPTRAHAQMVRSAVKDVKAGGGVVRVVLLLAVRNADKEPEMDGFPARMGMMDGFGRALLDGWGETGGVGVLNEDGDSRRGGGVEVDVAVTTMPYFHDKARAITQSGFYNHQDTIETEDTTSTAPPEQIFLAGFDTIIRIFNPKYYTQSPTSSSFPSSSSSPQTPMQAALVPFFATARLRVQTRPDDAWGGRQEQVDYVRQLKEGKLEDMGGEAAWLERVDLVHGQGEGVSSSRVREAVRRGDSREARMLVEDGVWEWIEGEGLYREG